MWEGVVNRSRGSFDSRLVMSSKKVFEVVLKGTLNLGTSKLLNQSSKVWVSAKDGSALKSWWIWLHHGVKETELVERFGCTGPGETISVLKWLSLGQGFDGGTVSGVVGDDILCL